MTLLTLTRRSVDAKPSKVFHWIASSFLLAMTIHTDRHCEAHLAASLRSGIQK